MERSNLEALASAVAPPPVRMAAGKLLLLAASPASACDLSGAGEGKNIPGKFLSSIAALIVRKGVLQPLAVAAVPVKMATGRLRCCCCLRAPSCWLPFSVQMPAIPSLL